MDKREREQKVWWNVYNAALTGAAITMARGLSASDIEKRAAELADLALDRQRKQTEPLKR